jgi:hypothetical protein
LVVANLLVIWWLRRTGFPYWPSIGHIVAIAVATAGGFAADLLLTMLIEPWLARVLLSSAAYCALILLLMRPNPGERQMLQWFVRNRGAA